MANKPKRLKPTDESVRTAEHLMAAGRAALEPVVEELKSKLEKSEQLYLKTGQHQAFRAMALLNEYLAMKSIADIITSKSYRLIPGIKTVHDYCKKYGIPYNTAFENVRITRALTEEEYGLFTKIGFTRQDFLGYASLPEDQRVQIKEGVLVNIEKADNTQLRALLEEQIYEQKKERAKSEDEKQDLNRTLKKNAKAIQELNSEIAHLEGSAKEKGLTLDEEAFLQYLDKKLLGFGVYMKNMDPENIEALQTYRMRDEDGHLVPTNVTPSMRAALIERLGYMRRVIKAAYDTAFELYGADLAEVDECWTPGKGLGSEIIK